MDLGPTFVKIGQQLSIRPDLIPPAVLYELQRLCDAVPPFSSDIAMEVLAESLSAQGSDSERTPNEEQISATILNVFESMPRLVASASLGQVCKGTLRDGSKEVAIKVQRPDMLETVSLDLFLLVLYGKTVDKVCSVLTNQIPYHQKFLDVLPTG